MKQTLLFSLFLAVSLGSASGAEPVPLPPDSTAPTGQRFAEPRAEGVVRVLLAGAGSSHDFPRFFLGTDAITLRTAGGLDVAATPNGDEALALLPQADVLVFSGNHPQFGLTPFQEALRAHADAGKGLVVLHAGAWVHPWLGYNQRFVGGGSKGHGRGQVQVAIRQAEHPVVQGLPAAFTIGDESYHHRFDPEAAVEVLAENWPDDKTHEPHASVWVVRDPKCRIVCITLGHAAEAHDHPAYRQLLTQAVRWVATR